MCVHARQVFVRVRVFPNLKHSNATSALLGRVPLLAALTRGARCSSTSLCNRSQPPSPVKNKNHLSAARVCLLKMHGGGSWEAAGGESRSSAFRKGIGVPRWTNGIWRGRMSWRGRKEADAELNGARAERVWEGPWLRGS